MNQVLKTIVVIAAISMVTSMAADAQVVDDKNDKSEANVEVRLASEIPWRKLNPARGDASPQAGTIWGDQTKDGESGFLVKFVDGFSSPPHIHNITYRGIVIDGSLHNDNPEAAPMWMKVGSYWTQPAGEVHITAARGSSVGYVEIQSGPYLVKPGSEAFDNGERSINVDSSNIVWLDANDSTWIENAAESDTSKAAQLAFLWGETASDQVNGTMLKLPAGFSGKLNTESPTFRIVVIKGEAKLQLNGGEDVKTLSAGGYFGSKGKASHHLICDEECIVYVRTKGKYSVVLN